MRLKDSGYEVEVREDEIKLFEEKVLFSGMCDFIIPMKFSNIEHARKITYDCSGYASVRDLKLKSAREIFEVLEKSLITLNKSIDFFIPPEKVTFNIDTIYYNMKRKNIKIAYIPSVNGNTMDHLNEFIDQLTIYANNETKEYLKSVKKDLNLTNKNIRDMASFVSEQRKRIYQCGIK